MEWSGSALEDQTVAVGTRIRFFNIINMNPLWLVDEYGYNNCNMNVRELSAGSLSGYGEGSEYTYVVDESEEGEELYFMSPVRESEPRRPTAIALPGTAALTADPRASARTPDGLHEWTRVKITVGTPR